MENSGPNILVSFLPLILMSLLMAIAAHLLAKEKGRNVTKWTILALIPIVNFACIWFFIGASNLKLERKIDDLALRVQALSDK
ncbi:hypothetical protein JAB6_12090 [Janthinobacterium sp. HH104]|uniref:Cardiolipin synthase N-terminal domain-containing protein n=2 Tax=Janthinobacterium TaxID=29580 RepID=A0AB38C6C5_9BURK|nr:MULTISPECIES: hypothetical protein [Janthinobacterium]EZP41108.1 hypothetical protein BW37_01057 [Janthinobacterium lividum]OEZ87277.1 hypothetical protein JAB6_12090 [Janthinobacterium sp. HH104]SFX40556.1 hypothetical protein SAMN03097694_1988 [Janthinobacterium lividum]